MVTRLAVAQLISCGKLLTLALHVATVVPMRISAALMAITVVVLVGVAGCTPETPPVLPAPELSAPPLFNSEEEVTAAAEATYTEYLAAFDEIYRDGGAYPERLQSLVSPGIYQRELEGFTELSANGLVGSGERFYDSVSLQSADLTAASGWIATLYLCQDYSKTDLFDSDGKSVVVGERRTRYPFEVSFEAPNEYSPELIVAEVNDWTGADFCSVD